ncbi:hypothetical protein KAI58_04620 [Candidatus Gracilibacteria bacterium]|nr:hypothetical protein [Candidatus Gracilibacteria bacterium]
MKKLFFTFTVFLFLFTFLPQQIEVVEAASTFDYWSYWKKKYAGKTLNRTFWRNSTRRIIPSTQNRTTSLTPTLGYTTYRTSQYTNSSESYIKMRVNPERLINSITEINETPIRIFQIGFFHGGGTRSDFTEAARIENLQFKMIDNSGSVQDFSDFSLVVDGETMTDSQEFDFNKDGQVTLSFNNLRLAREESQSLEFSVKVRDPDLLPHTKNSFRVRVENLVVRGESSRKTITTTISGRTVSDFVSFDPIPTSSGVSTIAGTPTTIHSKILSAGEKAYVLSLNLGANYDDFRLESVIVENDYGNSIDSWVSKINLVNFSTGEIVESTKFINGKAKFSLNSDGIRINRNQQVFLGFEVVLASTIRTDTINTQFKLDIAPSDMVIFGIGGGSYLPDSQKFVTVDSKTFFVVQNAGGGVSSSLYQPSFVSNGQLSQMYKFKIRNSGSRSISLGRVALDVFLSGVEFPGGGSVDDFELWEMYQGRIAPSSSFSTTSTSGSTVAFDTLKEIYISGNSEKEFVLKMALDNISGNDKHDSYNIKILGDNTLKKGTLSFVRGQGASFIWSDHSGSPHATGSGDWFSGYLFPGLPTNSFVKYRR